MGDSLAELHDKENDCTVTTSPKSPCILKPKALCFKKRKRLFNTAPLSSVNCNVESSNSSTMGFLSKSIATINPFKCMDRGEKRRRITTEKVDDFLPLKKAERPKKHGEQTSSIFIAPSIVPAVINEDANLEFGIGQFASRTNNNVALPQKQKDLPIDWSLKTKIRIMSSKPFPWRTSFRTSEEASGTTGFVRCLHSGQTNCNLDSSHGARLYQQCLVWMHPSIPWLNLFPRITNQSSSNGNVPALDQKCVETLHSNWCDSFRSLYQLVRTCQCPYFYLCAPSFTVMFRSGGVGSIIDIHAAITPTSRGLRKALAEEGIEFTMPLSTDSGDSGIGLDEKSVDFSQCCADTENEKLDDDENLDEDEEEEPGTWLESLGLSQQDFPSLNSLNAKRLKENKKNIDHRPESLVYVEGSETQGLVNFLINYPSCVSKFGPLAGVPPTLLSPVSFLGATLHANKVQHGKVQDKGKELYAVELKGPILPNTVNSLCALFSTTQEGSFKALLTAHQPTLAFAQMPTSSSFPSAFATENLKDCGLATSFIQHMCSKGSLYEGNGISTVTADGGLFSWT